MQTSINYLLIAAVATLFAACGDDTPDLNIPKQYEFTRDGLPTVSYSGQTARIKMAEELNAAIADPTSSAELLFEMFDNAGPQGEDVSPFSESELNSETKSISSKVAASQDFFSSNSVAANKIKQDFRNWINAQVNEINTSRNEIAEPGKAGQIAQGTVTRYINSQGLEFNQVVTKSLIGALMLDQILNNYLSPAVLDAGDNRADNDATVLDADRNYTVMEHKWDEAYGYLFGNAADPADPLATLGADDSYLNKYLGRVIGDDDFTSLAEDIYFAFRTGRAAITQADYVTRDNQADELKDDLSSIIGIRSVYYLEQGRAAIEVGDLGTAFHALSEGYGFIYSLQFTRKSGSADPYFSGAEVEAMLADLIGDGEHGLWTVEGATLSEMAETIADKFDFTVAEAAN